MKLFLHIMVADYCYSLMILKLILFLYNPPKDWGTTSVSGDISSKRKIMPFVLFCFVFNPGVVGHTCISSTMRHIPGVHCLQMSKAKASKKSPALRTRMDRILRNDMKRWPPASMYTCIHIHKHI